MDSPNQSFDLELKNMFFNPQPHQQRQSLLYAKHFKHKSNFESNQQRPSVSQLKIQNLYQAHNQASSKLFPNQPSFNEQRQRNSTIDGCNRLGPMSNVSSKSRASNNRAVKSSQFTDNNQTSTFLGLTYETHSKEASLRKRGKKKTAIVNLKNQNLLAVPQNLATVDSEGHSLEVNLEGNMISSISKGEVAFPHQMKCLKLSYNKLSYIGNLKELAPKLKVLELCHNRLFSIEGLKTYKKLQTLNLAYNYVGDSEISNLAEIASLRVLNLQHNQISSSVQVSQMITGLKNLKVLNLSENQLGHTLCLDKNCLRLKELNLSENRLQYLIVDSPQTNLKRLVASKNELIRINGLRNCTSLEELDLSYNFLTFITGDSEQENTFTGLKRLKNLNLSYNKISLIQDEKSLLFQSLKELYLRGNRLVAYDFINTFLTNQLQILDLGQNKLVKVENIAPHLASIKILKLDSNSIQNTRFLDSYLSLSVLEIQGNQIDKLQTLLLLKSNQMLSQLCVDLEEHERLTIINELAQLQMINGTEVSEKERQVASEMRLGNREMRQLPVIPMSESFTMIQHTDETQDDSKESFIRKVFLEDSKDQQEIFNDVIRISHCNRQEKLLFENYKIEGSLETETDQQLSCYNLPLQRQRKEKSNSFTDQCWNPKQRQSEINKCQGNIVLDQMRSPFQQVYQNKSPSVTSGTYEGLRSSDTNHLSSSSLGGSKPFFQPQIQNDYKTMDPQIMNNSSKKGLPLINSITPAMSKLNIQTISTDKYQTINSTTTLGYQLGTMDPGRKREQENFSTEPNFANLQYNFQGSMYANPNFQSQVFQPIASKEEEAIPQFCQKRLSLCPSQIDLGKQGKSITENRISKEQIQTGQQTIQTHSDEQTVTSNSTDVQDVGLDSKDKLLLERQKEEAVKELYCVESLIDLKELQQDIEMIAEDYCKEIGNGNGHEELRVEIFQHFKEKILTLFRDSLSSIEKRVISQIGNKESCKQTLQSLRLPEHPSLFKNISEIKNSSSILKNSEIQTFDIDEFKNELGHYINLVTKNLLQQRPSLRKFPLELLCKVLKEVCEAVGFDVQSSQLGKFLYMSQRNVDLAEKFILQDPAALATKSDIVLNLIKDHLQNEGIEEVRRKLSIKIQKAERKSEDETINHRRELGRERHYSYDVLQINHRPSWAEDRTPKVSEYQEFEHKSSPNFASDKIYKMERHQSDSNVRQQVPQGRIYENKQGFSQGKFTSNKNFCEYKTRQRKRQDCLSSEVVPNQGGVQKNIENLQFHSQNLDYHTKKKQFAPEALQKRAIQQVKQERYPNFHFDKENFGTSTPRNPVLQSQRSQMVFEELLKCCMYPLNPVSPDQGQRTFIDDLSSNQGSYEFKLLKQLFGQKELNAKVIKAVKAYNYSVLRDLGKKRGQLNLLFFFADMKRMWECLMQMEITSEFGIVLKKSLMQSKSSAFDQDKGMKKKKSVKTVLICLVKTKDEYSYSGNLNQLCNNSEQIKELKDDGYDCIRVENSDSLLLLNDRRCKPIYLLDYYFKE